MPVRQRVERPSAGLVWCISQGVTGVTGLGEEPRCKVLLSSLHTLGAYYPRDPSLGHLTAAAVVTCVHCTSCSPPVPFQHRAAWKEIALPSPHLGSGELPSVSLRVRQLRNYLDSFCTGDPSSLLCLHFSTTYGLRELYFILWVIIEYYFVYFVQKTSTLAIESSIS